MMPTKLTREKDKGTVISCGHKAAEGVLAREAKSGALLLQKGGGQVSGVRKVEQLTSRVWPCY